MATTTKASSYTQMKAAAAAKTAAANKAAQQKLQAKQTADAQAAQARANTATTTAAQTQAALNQKWSDQIRTAKTTAELTQLQAQARTAGATVDPAIVSYASEQIAQTQAAERAAQTLAVQQREQARAAEVAAQQQAAAQLRAQQAAEKAAADRAAADAAAVKAQQEAQAQAAQAEKDAAEQAAESARTQAADRAAAEKAAAQPVAPVAPVNPVTAYNQAQSAFTTKLNAGTVTQADIDAYTTAAKNVNISPSQTLINRATASMATAQQQADLQAQQAAKAAAIPVTTEAQTTAQRQAELQAAYDAQGPVAPTTTGATVGSGATYGGSQLTAPNAQAVDQQNIAQLQASTNPNQIKYQTALAQLQSSGQPFTYTDVISLGNQTSTAQSNAELNAFTNQLMQESVDRNAQITWEEVGKITALVGLAALGVAAFNAMGSSALGAEAASTAGSLAAEGATAGEITSTLVSGGVAPEAAVSIANTATGIATGAVDAAAVAQAGGVTAETLAMANATLDPIAALNAAQGWTAVDTAYLATIGVPAAVLANAQATNVAMGLAPTGAPVAAAPVVPTGAETAATAPVAPPPTPAPLYELSAAETAELMKNVDPNLINSLAPTTSGTAGGTSTSIFSGTSMNPITNVVTNLGVTNPIAVGALTGAGTSTAINLATGQPITGESILQGALGGGVAGGIGSIMPDFGGGTFGSAIGGAATNVGATIVVNAVTGQPITLDTLAGAALTGGAIGAAVGMYTDGQGNTTYQYDDGSSMTVNRVGTPVSATDSAGAKFPVAAVDRRTGEPAQLAPVEDRSIPAQPSAPPAGTVAVQTADGSVLYTDGQTYYNADGTVNAGVTNPTPGGATDTARLSEPNQRIITDTTQEYQAGRITWDEASARINQAVRNDINSGYLTNNGDGSYTAPDGTTYFMNRETGMYDAVVGVPGGTGSGPDTAPVTGVEQPIAPPVVAPEPGDLDSGPTIPDVPVSGGPFVTPTPVPGDLDSGPTIPDVPITPISVAPAPVPGEAPYDPYKDQGPSQPSPGFSPGLGQVTPGDTVSDQGEITITAPRLPPAAGVTVSPVVTPPVVTPPPDLPAPGPETEPNPPAPVEPPYEPPTYPPIYVPPVTPPQVQIPDYGPLPPTEWGKVGTVNLPGLNPGFITNVPRYYNNPSPVAAKYYYGQHPYQTGQTFDPALYNTLPVAPATPFGLQQMYDPRSQTITNLLRGVNQASQTAPYNMPQAPRV